MNLWLTDPKTKDKSVSLTLMVVSFVVLLGASTLHLSHITENTSSLLELFYATAGLYLGRKFTGKSGNDIEAKVETVEEKLKS